ncbi:RWD domain-containing protein 2B [Eucyclogobius newberryi]|uniref:RWD domain-containing protein 2B n=1 Tax=Eucyclogobius newberryi TaxID=166745 RepID=UPI003B5B4833
MSFLDWAECQLAEIELLSSMFPTQDELEFSDPLALALLRSYVEEGPPAPTEGSTEGPPVSRPQFQIKQKMQPAGMDELDVIVSCAYPSEYPSVLPEITVRCSALNRSQQSQLHSDLGAHLSESCLGDVCVLSAVDWLKDHLHLYRGPSSPSASPTQREPATALPRELVFTRLWIYSHHIYNKTKRKNILEWSKELGLTGFSMPGKPGVVCVEGPQEACDHFWARVKVLTWKKIMIRHREDVPLTGPEEGAGAARTLDSLRKFSCFEEAMFDPHGNRGNHMDLGQLYHFLNEKGLGQVFQMYFGIEGR